MMYGTNVLGCTVAQAYIYIYEPCCKLSCIVSCIEVTFKQGFEGFS